MAQFELIYIPSNNREKSFGVTVGTTFRINEKVRLPIILEKLFYGFIKEFDKRFKTNHKNVNIRISKNG